MKAIPLTKNKVVIVDDEDFDKLNQFKWCACFNGYKWYAVRNSSNVEGKQTIIYMHREIMNAPNGIQVDHRNNNGLFNCKENLRFATNQQNHFNQRNPHKDNKLGIKGVRVIGNKFQARIKVNGKQVNLGCFNVLGDADSAYRIAEEKYFGEFARAI